MAFAAHRRMRHAACEQFAFWGFKCQAMTDHDGMSWNEQYILGYSPYNDAGAGHLLWGGCINTSYDYVVRRQCIGQFQAFGAAYF